MPSKLQGADIKNSTEIVSAGATIAQLPTDDQIYVSASSINKTLKQAIIDGDIGGGAMPTSQIFTSGSGTYTTPANTKYIRIRMVGGGGGGGGAGVFATPGGAGSDGTNSTFGTITAGKGIGANASGAPGAGGTVTLGMGSGLAYDGSVGFTGALLALTQGNVPGGAGASSPLGGGGNAGSGGNAIGSGGATPNTGSGGGGASATTAALSYYGGGGGAGAYVDVIVTSPSSTYSYAVGAGGAGGSAGSGGNGGGAGAAGIIVVEEFY